MNQYTCGRKSLFGNGTMTRLLLFAALLLGLAICGCYMAQPAPIPQISNAPIQPLQIKTCPGNGQPCSFDNPVVAGNLVVVASMGGPVACSTCNPISDNHGDTWKMAIAALNYNGIPLWYDLNSTGGPKSIYFPPNTGWLGIIAEYPPSTGFDGASRGSYSFDNLGDDVNGQSSDVNWSHPIVTTESCELLIGWAYHGSDGWVPSAGPNSTMRAYYHGFALEDSTTTIPGVYVASLTWNDYAHWDMGSAAFKTGGCQ